ncbi:serine threonine protein kinase : Probable serine/threonine protein kinase OS=Planctomyces maris DSM 8797 GN=PM8797T_27337 PE=4 SV=1: PQQ_2 [Gemmata massiliana]|uniref:Pyrrolo-quinoline quinone repeat domain-containing protein n=1 Tax=Gemmata massiliana TaxID=1210884 RepID=A0A6P2CVH8_9BACT|nr:PQQ-binding-like beta-propeller repeat protein [Gemmata massiliana]VTR92607.1 serine threonine protein kinase : Probable serine/threonine protein kinase OS=Planctomyces maris DSM 8797 GN=PM8797T_27337 PE=4 SV=1: PQQ_2 [Gemmata massiliana]
MHRRAFLASIPATTLAVQLSAMESNKIAVAATDWPWWRGFTRDGIAAPGQKVPLEWSKDKNVVWEAPISGRGHGSPIVVADRVFLATADQDAEAQLLLCLDRKTGRQLWQTEVHKGNFVKGGNAKSSHASSSPACDGERVYINFLNGGAVYATAFDLNGKKVWQTKVTDYVLHQGFGSSPTVFGPLLLVTADNKESGLLAGLDRETGKIVWTRKRPKAPNYASPIIVKVSGKDQLVLTGCDLVTSLDPLTGKENWEIKGATTECVTSTVTDGKHVFTSGGYPKNHVAAVKIDGSGIAWENKSRVYVPSMLFHAGHLYAVMDEGNAICLKSDTGAEVWKGRLGGTFSASPIMVGEHVLAVNEIGRTFVFKATPTEFEILAENRLGDEVFATPVVCGGRIFMRVAIKEKGRREEKLYCLGAN